VIREPEEPPADGGTGRLMLDRAVGPLIGVELLSGLALGATVTALGWQAYTRAHDPLVLGLLGLAEFIPAALLALPAGHLADRHDRRWIASMGLAGTVLVALLLAADAAAGDPAVWPLYLLAFAGGCANAFVGPSVNPLLVAAVHPSSLSRVVAMSTSAGQGAMIAGPALGGLLQSLGAPAPYLLSTCAAAAAAVLLFAVPAAVGSAHVVVDDATLSDALAGVRFIFSEPPLLGAISLDLMAVLVGGVTALLPVFASDVLHVGAAGNGLLRAAPGVGAVLVGVVLSVRPLRRRAGPTLFAVVAAYGVCTVVFGLSTSFALSLAALAGLAGADMVSMLLRATIGPLLTPPALRGRVGAVERVFIGASNELGAFESGVAAALIGAVPAVVLGGLASVAVAIVWAWRFPSLRRIDRLEDVQPQEAPARNTGV
jgi:MFS family permease